MRTTQATRRVLAEIMATLGALILLIAGLPSVNAAEAGDAVLPLTPSVQVGSATWLSVSSPFSGDANRDSYTIFDYSTASNGPWSPCNGLLALAGEVALRTCVISDLSANTDYWVRVTFVDPDGVSGANPQIVGPTHTDATAVAATSAGTATATVGDTAILVSVPISGDANKNSNLASVDIGASASGPWTPRCATAVPDFGPKLCRLGGLTQDTDYWVRVSVADPDGVSGTNPQILGPVRYTGNTDLAVGKAISTDTGWGCCASPAQLVDGRTQDSAFSHGFAWTGGLSSWGGGSPGVKQATIDLGSVQTVARLDAWMHQNNAVPLSWKVRVSSDGINFNEVFSTSAPRCRTASESGFNVDWSRAGCGHSARFAPVQTRYVRYMFDDTTMFDNMHGWAVELEVFGPLVAQWAQLAPTGTPASARGFFRSSSSYDAANDRLIFFSGDDTLTPPFATDAWVLANASGASGTPSWLHLAPSNSPPTGRQDGTMVYDPVSNRLIVHGGCSATCSPALSDTWALSNANGLSGTPAWIQLPSAPIARNGGVATYDSVNNRMIIFGGLTGFNFTERNDVWVLADANGIGSPAWTQLAPTGTPPAPRTDASGIYDSVANTLTIFGGTTSNFNDTATNDVWVLSHANGLGGTPAWTQLAPLGPLPTARHGHSASYDPSGNRMIVFGGSSGNNFYNDVWVLTAANGASGTPQWIQIGAADGPPLGRFGHLAGYAPGTNRLFVTMGANYQINGLLIGDVWSLANANGLNSQPVPYSVSGTARDSGGLPLAGVGIADDAGHSTTSDSSGAYSLDLPAGSYALSASKTGYTCSPAPITISVPPSKSGQDFSCTAVPTPRYSIAGTVRDSANNPLGGVTVTDGAGHTATSNASGLYTIDQLLAGGYTFSASKANYHCTPPARAISMPPNLTGQDFTCAMDGTPWTFMIYMDGDNNLNSAMQRAIRAIEAQPANPNVKIVVLHDGPQNNDTERLLIQPGGNYALNVNKWSLGERNMGDPQTLIDFITWSHDHYPAEHYYLSIADHGRGTSGVAWDESSNSDYLTTAETRAALSAATNAGAWKIDVLHFDTCLMAMIEDAYDLKDFVNYYVANENLGWSVFAYDRYAQATSAAARASTEAATVAAHVSAATTAQQLASSIAEAYFNHPALQGYPRNISVLDLSKALALRQAVDGLADALSANMGSVKNIVLNTRSATQKFDSRDYYRITNDDEYLDLYDLAARLKSNVPNSAVQSAAQSVMSAISNGLVVAEHHQSGFWSNGVGETFWDLSGSHGVSIYFPPRSGSLDYSRYSSHQLFRFTAESSWDEFLANYFGAVGLPPDEEIEPGVPPLLSPRYKVYLPLIVLNVTPCPIGACTSLPVD
jgi:clostripain